MTWFMFWMWVAFSAVSAILQKAPSGFKDSGSWTKPSAEEGKTIPIVLGTCRLRGPNCLWFGDVSSKSIKKKSGGFMGIGAKKVKVGCKYFCGCVLGLSTTIDAVLDIIVGDKSFADAGVSFPWTYSASGTTKTIALDNLFGGKESEGGISGKLSFYFGSDSQTGNAYYAAKRGKSAPGFRGMCYTVLEKMYIGTLKYMKEWHFVVRHCPTPTGMDSAKANIDGDANPAHGTAYLMTTPKSKGGMGISISRLDISSFNTAATTLFNEGLGISLLIDDAQSADTWLATIRQTIDAAIYTDPVTGLWTMKLIRADYTPANLTEFTDADCVSNPKMTRPSWADTINKVIVRYNSRANGFTIRTVPDRDPGNRAVQGIDRVQTMDFPAISKLANARIVAARERKQLSYPVAAFELTLKRKAWSLRPGSAFLLTSNFLGISKMPCRVINIKYGALEVGEIQVEATEDIFGVTTTAYTGSTSSSWSNPSSLPVAVAFQKMVEAPYSIVGPERNILAMGTRGDTITEDVDVWVNEGNGYLEANTIDPAPSGTLQAIWSAKTAAKDITGFIISGTDLDTLLDANTNADGCARGVNLALVDDEWISWTTCTDNGDGTYTIAGVLRGIFDSVPADHASGAHVWFLTEGCSLTQIGSTGLGAGSSGLPGEQGIPGAAATIQIGTVESGTTASVQNSGTSQNAVLDFVLPKGDKGDKGTDGVTINWKDAYNASTAYVKNDAVSYQGSSFIALQETTGNPPDPAAQTDYWGILAVSGDAQSLDTWSLEKTAVYESWDGHRVYRQGFTIGSLTSNTIKSVAHSIDNVTFVNCVGRVFGNSWAMALGNTAASGAYSGCWVDSLNVNAWCASASLANFSVRVYAYYYTRPDLPAPVAIRTANANTTTTSTSSYYYIAQGDSTNNYICFGDWPITNQVFKVTLRLTGSGGTDDSHWGVYIADDSNNVISWECFNYGTQQKRIVRYPAWTYPKYSSEAEFPADTYVQIEQTASLRSYRYSTDDGRTWTTYYTEAINAYLTPTKFGILIGRNGTAAQPDTTCRCNWVEATFG